MVVNRGEMKRKRKEDNCINLIDHSPKRTKVQAQRKFAQGSNVSSPVITPIKEIETQERRDVLPEPIELLPMKRPNTEDFLTFLCFRGTPILPPNLNFFNSATMVDSPPEDPKETKNGPIMTGPIGNSPNERPFVAFGVRKRADPVVISKQMDKKRRHALALQTLRRKYQEQKMAKIRAIAVSKISEKVTSSKTIVRTRSISKTETVTKKDVAQKTKVKVKVVATKRIARRTIKQPIRTNININPNINSKMCLRSFRGRYIHRELQGRGKKQPKPSKRRVLRRIEDTNDDTQEISEFSSDDDEPLVKKAKLKKPAGKIVKKPLESTKKQENLRLTRSQRLLASTRKHSYKTVITRLSTIRSTRLGNKKIVQSAVLRNTRRTIETIKKTAKKVVSETKSALVENTENYTNKKVESNESKENDIKTRSKTEKGSKIIEKKLVKSTNNKREPALVVKKAPKVPDPPKKVVKLLKPKIEINKKNLKPSPVIKKKLPMKIAPKNKSNQKNDETKSLEPKVKTQSATKKDVDKKTIEQSKKVPEQSKKTPVEPPKKAEQPKKPPQEQSKKLPTEQPKKAPEQPKKLPEQSKKAPEQPKKAPELPKKAPEQPKKTPEQPKKAPEQPKKLPEQPKKPAEQPKKPTGDQPKKISEPPKKPNKEDKIKEKPTKEKQELKKNEKIEDKVTETKEDDVKCCPSRPSRKTKEAATLYMELLGHKLVNDAEMDEDNISIDSFPELPNVRKTEQREIELKAKAKFKETDNKTKPNEAKKSENESKKNVGDNQNFEIKDLSNKKMAPNKKLDAENQPELDVVKKLVPNKEIIKPVETKIETITIDVVDGKPKEPLKEEIKAPSKVEDKKVTLKAKVEKKVLKTEEKPVPKEKPILPEKVEEIVPKPIQEIETKRIQNKPNKPDSKIETFDDSLSESSNDLKPKNKKLKNLKKKPKFDQSFSDSDEEPLSNLTKLKEKSSDKDKKIEKNPEETNPKAEVQYKGKPKRECTKRPQNYLPLYSSSSDEEKFFHGFLKSEAKPVKEIIIEPEKCTHSVPSLDLSCKDVSRRFGKGKVNMSNEQIEKWLNDSAMATSRNLKKEEEELIKFEEKIDISSTPEKPKIETVTKSEIVSQQDEVSSASNQTPEKSSPLQSLKVTPNERKPIFKKKAEPIKNVNAFSANNESSVYAFEAEEDSSVSTPFRRPSRRPSSTATSKSEDEISKHEELSKNAGRFRLPSMLKTDQKLPIKPEFPLNLSTEDSTSTSFPVQANDLLTDNSNSECPMETDDADQNFFKASATIPIKIPANDSSQKTKIGQAVLIRDDKSSIMFPPMQSLQKTKLDTKTFLKQSTSRHCDRSSETSDDFKYKIPSSPSASSSSSAKLYKRPQVKNRNKNVEVCNPVNVTEFPSGQMPAQMVEAPVFHPTDKEFQDPLEYIEKIRPKAEKFGICRIVPPANFKPECKVADDMRFTAYNQYVNKMLHRWGPNFKELMAIRKYLRTQNISLNQPPFIGGMEIDLPRLYQTVQSLGGLKEVIEKKKWPKVSEAMKIPKSAQDRMTKLDDFYCKYLLPYDTLSPAEREKLFDEVETEWAKRESKMLSKIQTTSDLNKSEIASTESESESDDEVDECIVKGRNVALNAFYRIARNTMSMYFKTTEPPAEEVEQEFWKHVTLKNNHICVHSGSIDSGSWGYGFAVSKNSPFARHAWNLKVLTNNSGSVLRYMGPIMGVTVPTLHVGMVFSGCCWYRDPHSLPWIEYLHTGANKIWYGIPDSMSEKFHQTLLKIVPNYCRNKSIWLPSDTVMIPPNLLVENGVSLCRTVQEPGHFVIVFPKVFTSSLCTGYVVSESVYFASSYWLEGAQNVFDELRQNCEPSMFSLDRLLLSITMDQRSSVDILKQIIPTVQKICDREKELRSKLRTLGLCLIEKLPMPESPAVRKRKKLQSDGGDYECEVCRANLFISLVSETQDDVVYCLQHAIESIENKRLDVKNCKLMFTYSDEELEGLVSKINRTIDAKLQKKIVGKSLSMVVYNK